MLAPLASIKPTELPSPPEGPLRVVRACTRGDTSARELGELVTRDPILSAELVRITNSAYFGFASEITSAARAVTIIGQRALRNMALCIAVKEALKPRQLPAFPIAEFWEASLRRGVCARCLAEAVGIDGDTGFTAGLLQDFGLLVLFYVNPGRVSEWPHLARSDPEERLQLERQLFANTHDRVGRVLADSWELPADLKAAIGHHHGGALEDTQDSAQALRRLAACADWMAAVFTADNKGGTLRHCRQMLSDDFDLPAERADALLAQVTDQIAEAAGAMGFDINTRQSFEELIRDANLRLVEENLSFQEITWRLERAIDERDRKDAELHRELALAREVQRSLLPVNAHALQGLVGLNVSARAVSGDFYDFFPLRTGQIAFGIADVAGKGMNAAMLMAKASGLFHCLGKSIPDPGKLLAMLNHEILDTSIHGMFVTMVAGLFDPGTRSVRLCNAGHLPAMQMDGPRLVAEYRATAPPLGVVPDVQFASEEFQLGPNSSLYLYTDGLVEARTGDGKRLEREGLLRVLAKYADRPPNERLQHIVADVRGDNDELADDITLLLIET